MSNTLKLKFIVEEFEGICTSNITDRGTDRQKGRQTEGQTDREEGR